MTSPQTENFRKLYFTRTAFQVLWAAAVFATAATQGVVAAASLIVYPLWDVACTLYDLRTTELDSTSKKSQALNAFLGILAGVGIALTTFSQPAYAIGIFGAWALLAGLLQLVAGLLRRKHLGGQWAMILSGLQSTIAGVALGLGGLNGSVHAKNLGGYALFGALYFLIAGLLLNRQPARSPTREAAINLPASADSRNG